jgi:hypothetical protein
MLIRIDRRRLTLARHDACRPALAAARRSAGSIGMNLTRGY